jgi:FkbM family methyltransferase
MTSAPADLRGLASAKLALAAEAVRQEAALVAHEPIAIVGFDCRFPGGEDPESFWSMLAAARCAVRPVPADRWNAELLFNGDHTVPGTVATRHGCFLDDVRGFDAALFRIAGREAAVMDPQQRMLLETAWRALEHGAIAPDRLRESRTGIFVGLNSTDYAARIIATGDRTLLDGHVGSGNSAAFAAGRLAYVLGTSGPAATVDATCSSALLALHQASQSLHVGECDLAIVGGVHLALSPEETIYLSRTGALAPDGRSKPFAAEANGFGVGEGCAVVVMSRLSSAIREGHAIFALVRGSAVSHDGASGGLTVPNAQAQERVVRLALEAGCLGPGDIDLIEAHGTGTPLGDPIELRSLAAVFNGSRQAAGKLPVGSVKANVGHTEATAGLCGVAKVLLALQHETIPPQPPIERPTPHVSWDEIDLELVTNARPWPRNARPRRAGISAFGLSGTNVHVIIEEAPVLPLDAAQPERPCHVYAVSAPDAARLRALAATAAAAARAAAHTPISAICHSANVGRARHPLRAAVRADNAAGLADGLAAIAAGAGRIGVESGGDARAKAGIVFMVSGQGAAFAGMSRALYGASPTFRHNLDLCASILRPFLDVPLTTVLHDASRSRELLAQTRYAQPALTALAWSLAMLWRAWGVTPAALVGHSLGEYVAAALAGMIEIEPLLSLVARRGALMQRVADGGAMASVPAAADWLAPFLARHPDVCVAAHNTERNTVLSGPARALTTVRDDLARHGIQSRPLAVGAAFHSAMMDPILGELDEIAAEAGFAAPRLPLAANLTGGLHAADAPPAPSYWSRHAREPVQFRNGIAALCQRGHRLFLEIGPRPMLTLLAAEDFGGTARFVASMGSEDEWETLLDGAGTLWSEGADIDWVGFDADYRRRRIAQPPGPLQRKPFWFAETVTPAPPALRPPVDAGVRPMLDYDLNKRVGDELREQLAAALGEPAANLRGDCSFIEMGADSIMLADAARMLGARYGVKIPLKDLLGELGTIDTLAGFISAQRRAEARAEAAPAPLPVAVPVPDAAMASDAPGDVAGLMRRQLDLVDNLLRQQLATLERLDARSGARSAGPSLRAAARPPRVEPLPQAAPATIAAPSPPEDARRAAHRASLIAAYTRRTARSKALADQRRPRFADVRAAAGFRPSIKEMIYPITGERAAGARIWDVDGNEYIDVSMDFGANLFGHGAPLIREAMQAQLERGLALGPRSPLASEVADLMCELTGMDRVLFCQSGTESVMTAARLARLARGHSKIAVFRNSYHGHFDGFLGERADEASAAAAPIAPGILDAFVSDLLPLDYGSDAALETIRAHADQLAAVLVEPVQSRALHLQPRAFLQALRELTRRHGILLIFDEMITGFRVHPGGAQAHFGVEADVATYGKMLGGGVPMAAVAVRGDLLKGIDGGIWRFGDESRPHPETTFFAGTFNNHPLGLAAARAILGELKRQGPALQDRLNAQAAGLTDRLNARLAAAEIPLSLIRFGSVFRFAHKGNLDLLYFHLLHRGVFVWEGRNCFLSTAHGDAEIEAIADRVLESVDALRDGGFLSGRKLLPVRAPPETPEPAPVALSDTQRQIWLGAQQDGAGALAYVETQVAELRGPLDAEALERALADVVVRHEALRTRIVEARQRVMPHVEVRLRRETLAHDRAPSSTQQENEWIESFARAPFDLAVDPPIRAALLRQTDERHLLVVVVHHVLVDGWSLRLLMQELASLYAHHRHGVRPPSPPSAQLREHIARIERQRTDPRFAAHAAWWRVLLEAAPDPVPLAQDGSAPFARTRRGARLRLPVSDPARHAVEALSHRCGVTVFTAALGITLAYLHRLFRRPDLLIGIAGHGRASNEAGMIAQTAQLVPVRSRLLPETTLETLLSMLGPHVAELSERQSEIELASILEPVLSTVGRHQGALNVTFNLDKVEMPPASAGLRSRLRDGPILGAKFDLCINLTVADGVWHLDLDFDADAFSETGMHRFGRRWIAWAARIDRVAHSPVSELAILDDEEAEFIARVNTTVQTFPERSSLAELIAAQAAATPDRVAVSCGNENLTYGDLDAAARRVAAQLAAERVGRGDIVACILPSSPNAAIALLGVLYAGAAVLPLDPQDPAVNIRESIIDGKAAAIIGHHADAGSPAEPGLPVVVMNGKHDDVLAPLVRAADDDPIWVEVRPGSAEPVSYRHGALRNLVLWLRHRFAIAPGATVLQTALPGSGASVWQTLWPLTSGARLVVGRSDGDGPRGLVRLVQAERVAVMHLTPSMLDLFLSHPGAARCRSLTHVVCSGGPLRPGLRDDFFAAQLPAELHTLCAPGEDCGPILHWMCRRGDSGTVPIGHPIANTRARVLDRNQRSAPIGVVGELHVDGEALAPRHGRTAQLARYRADGSLERGPSAGELITSAGLQIDRERIEECLRMHPLVRDAVVDLRGAAATDQRLIAWVVPALSVPAVFDALPGRLHRTILPGGAPLICRNTRETQFVIDECFGQDGYVLDSLSLPANACVIDAGANIGVFALAVLGRAPEAKIYACEPIPEIFQLLRKNATGAGNQIVPVGSGLGARSETADFIWYPDVSILSGRHADADADQGAVLAFLGRDPTQTPQLREALAGVALERLQSHRVRCPVTTVSHLMRQHQLSHVDLLKIDVEGDEAAVLDGIEDEHWPSIDRLLIEIDDRHQRDGTTAIQARLQERGFAVTSRQAAWAERAGAHLLIAVRPHAVTTVTTAMPPTVPPAAVTSAANLARELRGHLVRLLPAACVPVSYIPVPAVPLDRHGRLDRSALPDGSAGPQQQVSAPPRTPVEQSLLEYWRDTLSLAVAGVDEDFIAAGGQSLAAAWLAVWIQERWQISIGLREILAGPTIAHLAQMIEQVRTAGEARPIQPRARSRRSAGAAPAKAKS